MNSGVVFFLFLALFLEVPLGLAVGVGIKSQDISLTDDYQIHIDYDPRSETVTFDLVVRTRGFVGFGISPNGDMTGADIVIGGLKDDGTIYFNDYHGTGKQMPVLDEQQDYILLKAGENATHTFLKFSRIVKTCDLDDLPFTMDTQKLIWAIGATDDLAWHGESRGANSAQILDPKPPVDISKFEAWDMLMDNPLPSIDTSYWCSIHKSPDFDGSHQLVGFDIILPSQLARQHIHHTDIFECDPAPGETGEETFESFLGVRDPGVDCYNNTRPEFPNRYCTRLSFGWAVGGQPVFFPEHTGFPFASGKYYMMERHFDNPQSLPGMQFESGMRMYYSNETRENEAAVWVPGSIVSYTHMLPPNSVNFTQVGHCSASCTEHFPEEGLSVFGAFLHAHTAGRGIKLRLFRQEEEMPWILYDSKYDFNYQQSRIFMEEVKIYRGDHITIECTYDTTWKNGETTLGGRSTRDEMCNSAVFYYPKMYDFLECSSEIPKRDLFQFLGIEDVELKPSEEDPTIILPEKYAGMKLSSMIASNISWTPELRQKYQELHQNGIHENACVPLLGPTRFETTYPKIREEYAPEDRCKRSNPGDNNSANSRTHNYFNFNVLFVFGIAMFV